MIRKFKILNEKYNNELLGYLYIDTEKEEFKVEYLDDYTGKHPDPRMIVWGIQQGHKYMDGDLARKYVTDRIMPPNRHALSEHLKNMGLKEYNIIDILDFTHGRCDMDHNYFEEIK